MTQPVQEPTQGRTDAAQGFVSRQLLRRPAPPPPAGSGSVGLPVDHSVQGWELSTYTAFENNEAFGSLVKDATAPFGGYISSVAANVDEGIYFGLGPLGYGTAWVVDLWLRQGADSGKVMIEFGTTPVDEEAASLAAGFGPPGLGSAYSFADPDEISADFSGWWHAQAGTIDLYSAAGTDWDVYTFQSFFFVAGPDGSMLTADAVNPGPFSGSAPSSETAFETGGGDVCWWIRIRSNGLTAPSTSRGFRFAGYRMYRANGNGGPVS